MSAAIFTRFAIAASIALIAANCDGGPENDDSADGADPQAALATAEFDVRALRGNLYALLGPGGTIGVSAGDDGVVIIDDQFAVLTDKLQAAVAKVSNQPIRFVLNTHWHPDHTGGNENVGRAGAVIVAQDNVRLRLAADQVFEDGTVFPAAPAGALPVITFDSEIAFRLNGQEARAIHMPAAHTDGDAIVYFPDLNIYHMGDVFISQGYPLVDLASGGSIDGMLDAIRWVRDQADADTIIIPGHGEIAGREDLDTFLDIIGTIRNRVAELKADGLSEDEAVAQGLTAEWDATYTNPYVTGDSLTRAIYQTVRTENGRD